VLPISNAREAISDKLLHEHMAKKSEADEAADGAGGRQHDDE
jgi:hypothetical protein